jgi:hypothetical protein
MPIPLSLYLSVTMPLEAEEEILIFNFRLGDLYLMELVNKLPHYYQL